MDTPVKEVEEKLLPIGEALANIQTELKEVIVGQNHMVDALLIALISGGHVLLEGVPGLAKTTAVKLLASAVDLQFNRIQFTPDLLPSDVIGTEIFQPKTGEFYTRKGPIFAQLILADEINRAPAKVQSALLEVMEERQVTVAGETFQLEEPFMVLATQNPIEQEGTYRLPEAQVDRFLLKILLSHPTRDEEIEILRRVQHGLPQINTVADARVLLEARALAKDLYVDPRVETYIATLVDCTRNAGNYGMSQVEAWIEHGVSPRATLGLSIAARAQAILQGRAFVTPQDVKDVAPAVLRHRLLLSYEADADSVQADAIVDRILSGVNVP